MIRFAILTALVALPGIAHAQDQRTVTARQVVVPVSEVLGGKVRKPTDDERDQAKEDRRHHRAMEKQLRRLMKDNPFTLASGPRSARKAARLRTLPPNAKAY